MIKLKGCRKLGRYVNPETGRPVNVYKGTNTQRGTDHLYFLRSGKRVFICQHDFYSKRIWVVYLELKFPLPRDY
jgi:hypothetical protein